MGERMAAGTRRGFVAGAASAAVAMPFLGRGAAAAPGDVGQWSRVYPWPCVAIHMILLPNRRVLTFADDDAVFPARNADFSKAYVVEIPANGAPSTTYAYVPNQVTNLFCAGHAHLPDGRVLVVGGHEGQQYLGSADVTLFESGPQYAWRTQANARMNAGRWYATATVMGNGEVAVVSGSISDRQSYVNPLPQVWQTNSGGGWRNLTNAVRNILYYPTQFLAPDGRLFVTGRDQATLFLDTAGAGQWAPGPVRTYGDRFYGSTAMYGDGKILMAGGGGGGDATGGGDPTPPTAACEVIDLTVPGAQWRNVAPMRWARRHNNATLLADGTVLVTGGSSAPNNDARQAVLPAELWNPYTEQWYTMASMSVARMYHSTAMLLPDGRVICAGGGRPPARAAGNYSNAQIYSPPYLFRGARPRINAAPARVNHGQRFQLETSNPAQIRQVTVVKLGAVTHTVDMDQRLRQLTFRRQSGRLSVSVPSNPNLLPPGHYMLFVLNAAGVPSVAKIIRIG